MPKRYLPFLTTAAVVLLVAGLARALMPTSDESPLTLFADGRPSFIPVDTAGTAVVRQSGPDLEIVSVLPADGYEAEIDVATGSTVQATFTGDGRRVVFAATLEGGEVRVTFEARSLRESTRATATTLALNSPATTAGAPEVATPAATAAPTTAPPPTTSPPPTPTTTVAPTTTTSSTTTTSPPTTTTTSPPTTTTTATTGIPDGEVSYSLDEAGDVVITFFGGEIVAAVPLINPGWQVEDIVVESDKFEIELERGKDQVELTVEIIDDEIVVSQEVDDDD